MVIHLVIGNVATAGTVSLLATGQSKASPGQGKRVPARIVREIKRVARAALMNEEP